MALSATRLGNAIRHNMSSLPFVGPSQDVPGSPLDQQSQAIAAAIVAEITGHAAVTCDPGTFAVGAAPGPVTGQGTGTVA